MDRINILRQRSDNFCYVSDSGVIVDVPDGESTLQFLEYSGIEPKSVLITHGHADHVAGLALLRERYPEISIYAPGRVADSLEVSKVEAGDVIEGFEVFHVPGHTLDDVCYFDRQAKNLFVGDVLFDAGCGRLFEGDGESFYQALQSMLSSLPADTKIFIGHDYSAANLKFAKHIEPENIAIDARLEEVQIEGAVNSPVLLSDQFLINPFLRVSEETVRKSVGSEEASEGEVFVRLRKLKDGF